MIYDTISINKSLIPYTFSILLGGEMYDLRIDYNKTHGFFTIGLSKDGEVVCSGEKIVYGKPLFDEVFVKGKFPSLVVIPYDLSGANNAVTFDNLTDVVQLIIDDQKVSILNL